MRAPLVPVSVPVPVPKLRRGLRFGLGLGLQRGLRLGLGLGLGLGLAAGCWTGGSARPVEPAPPVTPTPAAPFPRHSTWQGTYVCSQGESALRLVIDATPDGQATAILAFGPTPAAPDVARGAYRLRGRIAAGPEGTFELALVPDAWLDEPDGYTMTPLRARSSRRQRRMVGRIEHPACGRLDVRRTD